MRIDKLHMFSDGTLNDVRSALDDILKRIMIEYLPYKVVRHGYSNPMIQPEPEGSTQGYPLDNVEVLRIMDTTRAQQKDLDDDLVAPANRLQIGKCKLRLNSTLKSKEPALQVVLGTLKLTSFYKAFEITIDVPEIYMQEFWVTASRHHSSLRQKFKDPPFEEEILSFIREIRHTSEIKVLSVVNVNHRHQPWRSFAAIINKCLSRKITALEILRLSRAQIL
ncbi:hypothetical protein Tco_1327602 [Tanacetum coccineum]